ncbi:MAG: coproporphyrinogen dehydrogenase HemZ [Clostridia bacterium]|nr:coproporphyrinogen dehydrogenase HemZ [Clostridia bacterium]
MIETQLEFCKKDLVELLNMLDNSERYDIKHLFTERADRVVNTIVINGKAFAYGNLTDEIKDETDRKRLIKRYAKLSLYKALARFTGENLPWGALTGVRPTKLAYQQLEKNADFVDFFRDVMKVSDQKISLTKAVLEAQKGIYLKQPENTDLFVFIPFCPSRCKYCSFITADVKSAYRYIDEYVDALVKEIIESASLINNLRSIYIGGGTPVALSDDNLEKILSAIDKINTGVEYTVEAGRPDRITPENLNLLKAHGVTRVCINPQTFNDKTLINIKRNHTAKDIIEKFNLAKENFVVNMDLIAGLDGESVEDFKRSLNYAVKLFPDNITVHTLSVKNGSELSNELKRLPKGDIESMVDYAREKLEENGYVPYYLYRQKYMAGNLENVGYTKPGKACVYNVDIMEETTDIVACGAGAISKKVDFINDKIARVGAPKDVLTYISKLDTILKEKKELFSK